MLRRSPRHSTEKRIGNVDRSYSPPAVALSQVRRTDGRRRTIHSRTTPTPFSTAPGHGCMKSLAHTPHCQRPSERLADVCLRSTQTSSSCPGLASLRPSIPFCTTAPAATPAALTTPANFYTPHSLHSICISPASARQRLPSDGFFEHDAPHLPSPLSTHPGVVSEKALA